MFDVLTMVKQLVWLKVFYDIAIHKLTMEQIISNLFKLNNLNLDEEDIRKALCEMRFKFFYRPCSTNFTSSILEYLDPYYGRCKMLNSNSVLVANTARNVSKCRVFSGLYFPLFSPNKEKYGPEKFRICTLLTQC